MRKIILNLHLYASLSVGVFVVTLGITGSIMAFEPELIRVFQPGLSYVKPQSQALSLADLSAAVTKAFPNAHIQAYALSTSPEISYQVATDQGLIYVNQYSGEILGVQRTPGFIEGTLNFIHQLHQRLAMASHPRAGEEIVKWVGVITLFLLLSGLYLWWPAKRMTVQRRASSRRFWFDLHNMVGIFSLVFLLALTITGVVIGFEARTTPWFYRMTDTQPLLIYNRGNRFEATPAGTEPITPDQAVAIARSTLPGAAPFSVNVPGPKGVYTVRARYPEDRTTGGRSQVIVDQYSGKVLAAEGSRTAPAGSRLITANRAIHTGDIFGIPSKAIMSLASLMLVMQLVSGVWMWWKRKKSRRRSQIHAAVMHKLPPEAFETFGERTKSVAASFGATEGPKGRHVIAASRDR